jgi:hypothetical protein
VSALFEAIEGSAGIGNRTEADHIQLCAPKLTDSAVAYYRATAELSGPNITGRNFKASLLRMVRDVCRVQYHFTQLQVTPQRRIETKRISR